MTTVAPRSDVCAPPAGATPSLSERPGPLRWLDAALRRLYQAWVPATLRPRVHGAAEAFYWNFRRAREMPTHLFPRLWLVERSGAAPVRFLVAGEGADARYLADLFGGGDCAPRPLGRVPLRRLARESLGNRAGANVLLLRTDGAFAPFLRRRGFIVLPEWVPFIADVSPDGAPPRGASRSALRDDLRRVRKAGFTWDVTADPAAAGPFFRELYLPYITSRYGDLSILSSPAGVRCALETGVLLRVLDAGLPVAAFVIQTYGRRPVVAYIGIRPPSEPLLRRGVSAALYHFTIEWARERRYKEVDFRSCRPFLADGLFRYKRKWGMRLDPAVLRPWVFACKVYELDEPARSFLLAHPMVCTASDGLEGLVFLTDDAPLDSAALTDLRARYWTPGLRAIRVARLPAPGDRPDAAGAGRALVRAQRDARIIDGGPPPPRTEGGHGVPDSQESL